jgi:nucleoside-diphosphate-sugar epimerase
MEDFPYTIDDSGAMKVAIWGAAGAIGHAVASELERRGIDHVVVGRSAARLAAFPRAERVVADVADPAGCARAAEGATAVVYTLGLPFTRRAFAAYPVMMRHAVAALRGAGVRRLVHISNVFPYGRPRTATVDETHPREPVSVKGRYRKEQEDVVLGAHQPGALETVVLRLPDFFGPHADLAFGNEIVKAAVAGRTANLLAPADTPHQFCSRPTWGRSSAICSPATTAGEPPTTSPARGRSPRASSRRGPTRRPGCRSGSGPRGAGCCASSAGSRRSWASWSR